MMESLESRKRRILERSKDLPDDADSAEKSDSENSSSIIEAKKRGEGEQSKAQKGTFFRGNRKVPVTLGRDSPGPASYLYQNYTVKSSVSEGKGALMLGRLPTPRTKRRLQRLAEDAE